MRAYIIRRLLLIIPTGFLVTVICFISVRFIPGSIIDIMVQDMAAQGGTVDIAATSEAIRQQLGLDVPIHIQYGRWIAGVFQGDLGVSMWTGTPVIEDIFQRLPVSIELGLFGLLTAILLAMPVGIYSAIRQDTWGDYVGRTVAILAISVPSFRLGTLVVVYPSIWWNWTPPIEYIPFGRDIAGNLLQFIIPGTILGLVVSGTTMRMTRTMMLEVLRQDYIRTAWAKGLNERVVIFRHALKNALIPVITLVGILLPILVGGSVVLEQIFVLPGVGRLLVTAIQRRDYPIIVGINLVVASFVLFVNLAIDIIYSWLDPRITYR